MRNALIMGAAGRDFHNFNTFFRHRKDVLVKAFTATQIPGIDGKKYPAELAGDAHPEYAGGIDIFPESELERLIRDLNIQDVYFSYSDVPYPYVMSKAAVVNKMGANFVLLGPNETMIESTRPVISICAVRTGCGKSQTTRAVSKALQEMGLKVAAIRHPMPYGDLVAQKVQRYGSLEDLKKHKCTIEEMEEYEPHIVSGTIIYAGVDYEAIIRQAEQEADVILWDGGNNDFPFYRSDLEIVVVDPFRPGHELNYYPGEVNFRRADVIVINKMDTANLENILKIRNNIRAVNPDAVVVDGASPVTVDKPELIRGKRVLVVEDGPTLTHGGMQVGAGVMAAFKFGACELVNPRACARGELIETYKTYPQIGDMILPAMGYGDQQIRDLEATINSVDCDSVVVGTPIDLGRILKINKPTVRVGYDLDEIGHPSLREILEERVPVIRARKGKK